MKHTFMMIILNLRNLEFCATTWPPFVLRNYSFLCHTKGEIALMTPLAITSIEINSPNIAKICYAFSNALLGVVSCSRVSRQS